MLNNKGKGGKERYRGESCSGFSTRPNKGGVEFDGTSKERSQDKNRLLDAPPLGKKKKKSGTYKKTGALSRISGPVEGDTHTREKKRATHNLRGRDRYRLG